MIFLGVARWARLGDAVSIAAATGWDFSVDLGGYPSWLVVLVGTLTLVLAIWVFLKLLKWTLWLLLGLVLFGGVAWAAWLWFHQ